MAKRLKRSFIKQKSNFDEAKPTENEQQKFKEQDER